MAIRAEGLSKLYRIGEKQERYKTLRDALADIARSPLKGIRSSKRSASNVSQEDNVIWALKDVSFEIKHGEIVGIIGRNGAGKSTLLKILSRITEPTEGYVDIDGRIGSLLEVGTGFHPELTGRENIFLNGTILGMKHREVKQKFDEIIDFAEVEKFIDTPVKHYSSGMYLRLAFAVAAFLEPDILLVDEVLAVGDALFQKKCLGKMEDVSQQGRTVLFVSHNMSAIRSLCSRGLLINNGSITEAGDINTIIGKYVNNLGILVNNEQPNIEIGKESVFKSITIKNEPKNAIDSSKGFILQTSLSIPIHISRFSLFCILQDMYGRTVFHLREESSQLGLSGACFGNYDITMEIPALWLNPGSYSIYFKILFWGKDKFSRHVSNKIPLDFFGDSSGIECILNPKTNWILRSIK
ncbi:MAG: ABC transporter ATP-binding protein [Nitrosopumilus sp.]|nr:ABC transporter ATP-binding protein [Nitrosopumilus sp.]